MYRHIKGATFIEIILALALVLLLGTLAAPFYGHFAYSGDIPIARDAIEQSTKQAKLYTLIGKNSGRWGVAFRADEIVLFQGDTYDQRDVRYDESYPVASRVTISGADEIVFDAPEGTLSDSINLVLSAGDTTEELVINREGIIE